jgi:hypothetical protein
MERNAYRDEYDADQTDAYWRRRAVTLAAGLGLLGLLAWAFTGGGGKPAPPPGGSQPSGPRSAVAYSGSPTSPSTGASGVGPTLASPTTPGPSVSPRTTASRSPGTSPGGRGSSPTAAAQGGPPGRCSPGTLVLSLFTSKLSYSSGQYPEFEVYAVSTSAGHCALDLGASKLTVVVMSSGRVIWDSADCAAGAPGRVAELSRGVPAQESIVWNRAVSLPGCVTLASARQGSYQVQARTSWGGVAVSSPVRTFRLAR